MSRYRGRGRVRGTRRQAPGVVALEARRLLASSADVLTYHVDNSRDGVQSHEIALTPANVNVSTFGKVGFDVADGKVDAEPLFIGGVPIPGDSGHLHDLLIVASEHDTVYAYDAESGAQIWKVTMLGPGEVPSDPVHGTQVAPEIGVTATPVIDPAANTVYVVAMSKLASGGNTTYIQRIHALDLGTGLDKVAPRSIDGSIMYPGTGPGGNGSVVAFDPMQYKERDALLLSNGVVYTSWASHSDVAPYTGWVIGFKAGTLALASVLNVDPNGKPTSSFLPDGSGGTFWNSGGGPAADASGNIYNISANGPFDTNLNAGGFPTNGDYGDSFLRIIPTGGPPGLGVADYFTPYDQLHQAQTDTDLGSGGIALTSQGGTQVAVGAGKDGNLYLINTANMGKYSPNGNFIYQEIPGGAGGPEYGSTAIFNGRVYLGGVGATLRYFQFTDGHLAAVPTSQTFNSFTYPGTTPTISANGTTGAIAWAVQGGSSPVLAAYDANDLTRSLYVSNQAAGGRDALPATSTFVTPTVANGRVYVGTATGVAVYSILNIAPPHLIYVAGAIPNVVAGTSTTLGAYAVDPTYPESSLVYIWGTVSAPAGAPAPVFTPNQTGASDLTTVTVGAAGQYTFGVVIADPSYRYVTSETTITVLRTPVAEVVLPSQARLSSGQSEQFTAYAQDQFGTVYIPGPGQVTWALTNASAGGTITQAGLYTAPAAGTGFATVDAVTGGVLASAQVAYVAPGPQAVHVNFTNNPQVAPPGYVVDNGQVFGARGNGLSYGWNLPNTAYAAERYSPLSPDALHDGFVSMQNPQDPNAVWAIQVPNGTYYVRVIAGDPAAADQVDRINVNGVLAVGGQPTSANRWVQNTILVTVTNGLIFVTNAPGSVNNKIDAIDIVPSAVTPSAAVVPSTQYAITPASPQTAGLVADPPPAPTTRIRTALSSTATARAAQSVPAGPSPYRFGA